MSPLGGAGERVSQLPRALVAEESSRNHWVGAFHDVALVFAYEGSHDDVRHVLAAGRVVERLGKWSKGQVKLLFVLPQGHSKPPEAGVRAALGQAIRRQESNVSRAAVVVLGTGFGAAIHRGVAAGLVAVLRARIPLKVTSSVRDGLSHLIEERSDAFEELVRACEGLATGPAPGATSAAPPSR